MPHPDLLPRRRPSEHSPRFSEMPITIGLFENDEQRYKVDVVDVEIGFVMQHRLLSPELVEGWRGGRVVRPDDQRTER